MLKLRADSDKIASGREHIGTATKSECLIALMENHARFTVVNCVSWRILC